MTDGIDCVLEYLRPKLKGGRVCFSVEKSIRVETECLPVLGQPFTFRIWEEGFEFGKCVRTSPVKWIEPPPEAGNIKTYMFQTGAPGNGHLRITITDPIFAGT